MITILSLSVIMGSIISMGFLGYDVWKNKSKNNYQRIRHIRNLPNLPELVIRKRDKLVLSEDEFT